MMLDEVNSVTDTPCGAGAQLRDRVEGWRDPVTLLLPGEVSGSLQVLSTGEAFGPLIGPLLGDVRVYGGFFVYIFLSEQRGTCHPRFFFE